MAEQTRYQYRVTSKWCGFWGGFGSEHAIVKHLEGETVGGWSLVGSKIHLRLWFWVIPRPKILFIYSRSA